MLKKWILEGECCLMDVEWEEPKSGTPIPDLPSCEFGQILPHLWNSGFCSISQAYKFLHCRMGGRISQGIKMDKHLECCVANGRQSKNARSEFIHSFIHSFIFTEHLLKPRHLATHKGLGCFERPWTICFFPGRWVRGQPCASRRMGSRDLEPEPKRQDVLERWS